jgi:hypothetical protein
VPRLALLCALAVACSPRFDPQYLVHDLRILAIRAEAAGTASADVSPGDTLVLRALVANPRARPGAAVRWYACLPASTESAGPCEDVAVLADPHRLVADPRVTFLGACEPDATGECALSVPVPDAAPALDYVLATARSDPAFSCRLYAALPVVALASASGREVMALKRVRLVPTAAQLAARGLTSAYAPNRNPTAAAVVRDHPTAGTCAGGLPVTPGPYPARRAILCATDAAGDQEAFWACGPAGERTATVEDARWQWFVTAGTFPDFEDGAGNANGNELRFDRPAGPFTLWVIVRDGRGGEAWLRQDVGPAP